METPSVGRIVHFVSYGSPDDEYPRGVHRAAIITDVGPVNGQAVSLCVINPTGVHFTTAWHDEETKSPGSWHWPERK